MTPTGRVLIVDDDPIVHTIFKSYFASFHVKDVLTASNGKQAANLLSPRPSPVRLIVMDINMPEMDGIELLKTLHEMRYDGHLVICSASHGSNLESALLFAQSYKLNLREIVRKPLSRHKLDQVFGPLFELAEFAPSR